MLRIKQFMLLKQLILGFLFVSLTSNALTAQNVQLTKGYYLNLKGEKVEGFFEMDLFRHNKLKLWASPSDAKGKSLDIADVEKVVMQISPTDSLVLLTEVVTYEGQSEKIYLTYLLRGNVNLLRGVSKSEKDIFFIYSTDLPQLRRISSTNP